MFGRRQTEANRGFGSPRGEGLREGCPAFAPEEAFRLLLQKHNHDEQNVWARFETELTKRTAEIERQHGEQLQPLVVRIKELESAANVSVRAEDPRNSNGSELNCEDKLRTEHSQKVDLSRRVEDYFREITQLRDRNQELESRDGEGRPRRQAVKKSTFAHEARTWAGVSFSEKLRSGRRFHFGVP